MSLRIILVFGLITAFVSSRAQNATKPCATMEQDSINRMRYPERNTFDDFERSIQVRMQEIRARKNSSGRIQSGIITIPIIVHVIHNGEPVGTGMNISKAQIQAQIDVLNEDYRKKVGSRGYNTSPVGADIEIEFCLSPVDENGTLMSEPGIDRYNGGKSSWTQDEIEALKPITISNPNLFFNVWTVKFGGTSANLLGYAQFPDQSGLAGLNQTGGPASTDGVVVQYSSFGSVDKGNFPVMQAPYNLGRTLSHETGHWLGLRHIWGDGVCGDDFVADTPTQRAPSNGNCIANTPSCSGPAFAMVQNYMDYSNDACMNIFTAGQKTRMQAVMELSPRRKSLIDANLCSPNVVDVPTPNFSTENQKCVLLGSKIAFTDLSTNFPNEWHWIFEGGNPSSSLDRNPVVTYDAPGNFKVSLWTKNSVGASDTLEIANYINVSEEGLCRSFNNFQNGNTPSEIKLSNYGNYTGYLTGHNSLKSKGISEFFVNDCGYKYISGVKIQFSQVYSSSQEATATVIVWNARGPQRAPGAVIERKVVLLKQIQEDVANNRPTTIVFDRETPVFGKTYQVGLELNYANGDSLAIQSSADGESTNATSWIQDATGAWKPYAIAFGANIAMNIEPVVGMNPSVQVSASTLLVNPGGEVTLNGRGASIFVWSAADGSVQNYTGPQLIAHPTVNTTFITTGSGLTLCNDTAYTTIYVREGVTGIEDDPIAAGISLFPNPGTNKLNVVIENSMIGTTEIRMLSALGKEVTELTMLQKSESKLIKTFDTSALQAGLYLVRINIGEHIVIKKWVKY